MHATSADPKSLPAADRPAFWRYRPAVSPTWLTIVATVFFAVVMNTSYWHLLASRLNDGFAGSPLLGAQMVGFMLGLTLLLLSLFRVPYVLKPVLIALLLASAGAAYFMDTYGVVIDADMLRNALKTDPQETAGLLTPTLFLYLGLLGVLPAILVWRVRLRWAPPIRSLFQFAGLVTLALAITAGSVAVNYKAAAPFVRSNGKQMRLLANPINVVQASIKVARQSEWLARDTPYQTIADVVGMAPEIRAAAPNLVVLVVGETARSGNFSLNGYQRKTNPELESVSNVVSFSTVASCGTATAISLPCMFSNLDRDDYSASKVFNRENLLDLAARAGYKVVWIENQAGSQGVADRVGMQKLENTQADATETSDAEFIKAFNKILREPAQPTLLVLHQMGSHGPEYFKRSRPSSKAFLPECQEKQLDRCSGQEIINAYDNTVVETDHMLAGLIRDVEKNAPARPVSLLYIGDHGESLGEHGLYLHGMPYAFAPQEQTSVPMIYWANKAGASLTGVAQECARAQRTRGLSQDNYFDSVLGLLRIETDAYRSESDMFQSCRPAGMGNRIEHLREAHKNAPAETDITVTERLAFVADQSNATAR